MERRAEFLGVITDAPDPIGIVEGRTGVVYTATSTSFIGATVAAHLYDRAGVAVLTSTDWIVAEYLACGLAKFSACTSELLLASRSPYTFRFRATGADGRVTFVPSRAAAGFDVRRV